LLPSLPNEPLRWVQAEDLWHEARILIGERAERAQAKHRLYSERLARVLTESGATLLATQQITALTGAVVRQLPRLGIPGAWMALKEGDELRLIFAYDVEEPPAGGPLAPDTTLAMPTLVPAVVDGLGRRTAVIVEP